MNSKVNNERDLRLSKKLSFLLRHGAVKAGLEIKPDGFVAIEQVLLNKLKGYTVDDIKRVVANNDKQRFALRVTAGVLEIRANQGHSLSQVCELSLTPIENPDFDIIHGTYLEHWPRIKIEGLSRMKRNHIHFAKGVNFICGLRKSAEIFIFIDFQKATHAGLRFFESDNSVILSAGNERGFIKSTFFFKVITRDKELLYPES